MLAEKGVLRCQGAGFSLQSLNVSLDVRSDLQYTFVERLEELADPAVQQL